MATRSKPQSVMVIYRSSANGEDMSRPWDESKAAALGQARPWRTFRWHRGQKHYSGTFWSSTERDHVIYESRLELTRPAHHPRPSRTTHPADPVRAGDRQDDWKLPTRRNAIKVRHGAHDAN